MTPLLQQWLLDHLLTGRVTNIEALELLALLPDASVDAIITDLPYGTTACAWDEIIPFAPMWAGVMRVLKPRGVFVTTASQPFTSALVMSNPSWFKYSWVWDKKLPSGFLNAPIMPLKRHEDVLVFGDSGATYYPIMQPSEIRRKPRNNKQYGAVEDSAYGTRLAVSGEYDSRYPTSILEVSNANQADKVHSTQKPVALYRYLVRTYTRPGDLVLDFCCGSATTGMACREEGRRFVLGEKDADIAATAQARLDAPYTPNMFAGAA